MYRETYPILDVIQISDTLLEYHFWGVLMSSLKYTLRRKGSIYRSLKGSISAMYLEPLKGSIHS